MRNRKASLTPTQLRARYAVAGTPQRFGGDTVWSEGVKRASIGVALNSLSPALPFLSDIQFTASDQHHQHRSKHRLCLVGGSWIPQGLVWIRSPSNSAPSLHQLNVPCSSQSTPSPDFPDVEQWNTIHLQLHHAEHTRPVTPDAADVLYADVCNPSFYFLLLIFFFLCVCVVLQLEVLIELHTEYEENATEFFGSGGERKLAKSTIHTKILREVIKMSNHHHPIVYDDTSMGRVNRTWTALRSILLLLAYLHDIVWLLYLHTFTGIASSLRLYAIPQHHFIAPGSPDSSIVIWDYLRVFLGTVHLPPFTILFSSSA